MNGLDALATAIMWREGPFKPPNRSFRNCNPGNLRSPIGFNNDDGFNIYNTVLSGYFALWNDLRDKFTGHNEHGLGQNSTLAQLIAVYAPKEDANDPESYAAFAAAWVGLALGKAITVNSLLSEIWAP